MIWIETPTNPTMKIVDIQAVSDLAHKYEVSERQNLSSKKFGSFKFYIIGIIYLCFNQIVYFFRE